MFGIFVNPGKANDLLRQAYKAHIKKENKAFDKGSPSYIVPSIFFIYSSYYMILIIQNIK